jgi:hypothetical protein
MGYNNKVERRMKETGSDPGSLVSTVPFKLRWNNFLVDAT